MQYDAQLASAKIEKQLFNCNEAIYWTTDQVVMIEDKTVHAYCRNAATNMLYYGTGVLGDDGKASLTMYLLAENVNSIAIVNAKTTTEDGKTLVKYVQLQMELERNDKTYTVEKTVSLRNKPELKQYEVSFVY